MTSKLSTLLKDIDVVEIIGETDKNITSLESDSRKVEKDGLFVAVKGVTNDGHKYIPMVASAHVGAIVCENLPAMFEKGVTYIKVSDSAEALGRLASAWYGHPSSRLKLVGVTGTNGKTTTATLLYEMAKLEGFKAGLLSTVCNYVVDRAVPTTHTTPDPLTINSLLAEMVSEGCEYAFMEVSSHAMSQKRVAGLQFAGGIFTNLTRDHLDYHGTVENYMNAKKSFSTCFRRMHLHLSMPTTNAGVIWFRTLRQKSIPIPCVRMQISEGKCLRRVSTAPLCFLTVRRWRLDSPADLMRTISQTCMARRY